MKRLNETRGRHFELVRHFLRHMFDGEWSSAPGQWRSAVIGVVAMFLPAGLLLIREGSMDPKYAAKYRLIEAAGTGGVRSAAMADEVALITLIMCITGLIALLEWQSLFPSGRDYLALASLPVRPRQVFTARFTSVLLFSAAIVAVMNILPSAIAPMEFGGSWQLDSSYLKQATAQALASGLACFFTFFAIVALQGAFLNLLPARLFARVSACVQGALAGVFLFGALYSWSMKEWKPEIIARQPDFGTWLPPVWFTGLHQALIGPGEPFFTAMALKAQIAAGIVVALTIATYLISYRRYRKLLLESPAAVAAPRIWRGSVLRLLARSPRQEAVMDFMAKTLVRSRSHRVLWLVYLGAAGAVLLNSSLVDGAVFMRSRGWYMALSFVVHFWPLACSVVVLSGFRHVLSIPAELGANWIFRITESHGRAEWMAAVERFAIAYAVAPIYLALFPVAGVVLGWPVAIRLTVLQLLVSLSIFEALFYSWQKLPFTCSHIPGDQPLVGVAAKYTALLGMIVPTVSVMIGVASQALFLFPFFFLIFAAVWICLRRRRREGWGETKLIYEDVPAVVIDLGIKELTYAGSEAQRRRNTARDAGHADSENSGSGSNARIRRDGVHSPDLGGCIAGGGGGTLPGAASPGVARPVDVAVGRVGKQPQGQILPPYAGGTQSVSERDRALAKNDRRYQPDHGASLVPAFVAEALSSTWLRLRTLFRRHELDRDLEDELQFHLAMRRQKLQEDGIMDAPHAARQRFGNVTLLKEACRDLWTLRWVEILWQDVRYGLRQLRVNRGFALAAAATLALGIAATTTIYSICDVLVWEKLPLADPDKLVMVLQASPENPHLWNPSSPADVEDIRKSDTLFESLASWENAAATVVDLGGEPLRVDQARVTTNFFDVLGVAPELGRLFAPDEDQPGREREVVLSDGLWRRRFGSNRSVLGKSVRLNNRDYTVIGVMPPKFAFPRASKELWTPLALTPEERNSRSTARLDSVVRLKPGHTLAQVQAELDRLGLRLEKLNSETNVNRRFMAWTVQRYVVGDYAMQFARLLLGAALFVLLIACVNVANLHLARGTARWREVALRQALGASRARIVTQLVVESVVLAVVGASIGIVLARFGLHAIRDAMPPELQRYSSGWADLGLSSGVLAFVVVAAVLSGIVAGLGPALRSSRPNLTESLKEGAHSSAGPSRQRMRALLLSTEIALTVVLLVGAGLMVHGFRALLGQKTAVEPATLLTLRLDLGAASPRPPDQVAAFYQQVLERIRALPGVQAVAAVSALPYSRHAQFSEFAIRGRDAQAGSQPKIQVQTVSPDYFRTMHIPLIAGRVLSDNDRPHSSLSAVVSEEMARQWWPGEPAPIGRQIRLTENKSAPWLTIVGVIGGVKASIMENTPRPTLYLSYTQFPREEMDIAIRASGDPLSLAAPVRSAIGAVDAEQPVSDIMTLKEMKQNEAIGLSYAAALMSIFGVIALALSCVGVFGMTAYLVSRQTHEIGIRMALGATSWPVLRGLFRRSSFPALAGLAVGLLLSRGLARLLASVIWGVSATDPSTFAAVPLLLVLAVGLAIYLPARRAVKIHPLDALRTE